MGMPGIYQYIIEQPLNGGRSLQEMRAANAHTTAVLVVVVSYFLVGRNKTILRQERMYQ
jgi:hypothetical protein